ncbi:MAG: hypothetical protein JWS10_2264 [Cypionkella sp.]|uniref:DUF6173 family protein n=1 Tax=Cypionkella sp. TaxID=2811411 RepID=UPI00263771A1|nr:DUF6173 family protein [Cypionkella sp.]MDB5659649.1 hypothetical protein [Cypionkella sp.]MDB5665338.1 hypothetical protein [Cypionkella sp.]
MSKSDKKAKAAPPKIATEPRAHAVQADPTAPPTAEQQPLPDALKNRPVAQKSPAEWAYERIILYIRNFESQLNAQQEIAMGFAGSEAGILKIEGLGFFDPDLLTFYGRDEDGVKTQLIQHVSQLSVMLRAIPKATPEQPPIRIGFRLATGWMGGESGDGSA